MERGFTLCICRVYFSIHLADEQLGNIDMSSYASEMKRSVADLASSSKIDKIYISRHPDLTEATYRARISIHARLDEHLPTLSYGQLCDLVLIHTVCKVNEGRFEAFLDRSRY